MASNFNNYSDQLVKLVEKIDRTDIDNISDVLWQSHKKKQNIFFAGNGGSASTATHIAADLGKNASGEKNRFKTLSLVDNIAWITALGNDLSYEDIFIEQLKNFSQPNDLFFMFSVSGNSPNLLKAVKWANKNKLITIGFLGKDGGALKKLSKYSLVIESNDYGLVESIHSYLHHYLVLDMHNRIRKI